MAKTSLRSSSLPGVWRLLNATNLESTFGAGQKIERDTDPAPVTSAHQAAFTDGIPYSLVFGLAANRSATSEEFPIGEERLEPKRCRAS